MEDSLATSVLDALPELIHPVTGRVHASFNQVVTATGRLSSSDPNLQNIPIRTTLGLRVREAFIAADKPEWLLLSADYSQIDLRALAHLSQDPTLMAAFERDEDIHASTASLILCSTVVLSTDRNALKYSPVLQSKNCGRTQQQSLLFKRISQIDS